MADIPRFHRGPEADLPSSGLTAGHYYQCIDTGELYLATSATDKVLVGKGKTAVVTGVKGDTESSYRTGNVNITPANVGAVPTTRKVAGKALSGDITLDASDVGLGSSEQLTFTLADGTTKTIKVVITT